MSIFARAEIEVEAPDGVQMGDAVPCIVRIRPTRDTQVRKILVEFACEEMGIVRGTSNSYYYHDAHLDSRKVQGQSTVHKGQSYEYRETFQIPPAGPPTFHGQNHSVYWEIRVRVDIPWWPDSRHERQVRVDPVARVRLQGG